MAEFKKILEETLLNEGGFSDDPEDNGGMTLFGIARTKNPQWAGWKEVDQIIRSNGWNSKNKAHWPLIAKACKKIDSVEAFYRTNYWNEMKGENIFANSIAQTIFDYGVNTGIGTAIKNVQRTLKIVDDGDFGPKTLATLNSFIMTESLYKWSEEFTLRKLARYVKIVTNESENIKFIFGWTSRSFENLETMYDLDLVTEPTFNELYSYVKAGRNDKALRLDTDKCMYLVKKCLKQYGIM